MANREPIKILYVEDNMANRLLVRRLVEAQGWKMIEAEDGLAGIEAAKRELPDLILMDINIPGMDGYEVTTKLKGLETLKDTPIIALTAKTMIGDRERALAAGCDGYIPKPIDVDTIADQLREFLGGKREIMPLAEERVYLKEHTTKLVDRLEEKIGEPTEANEELRRMDQVKSRFIAIAAHELKTPLTLIQGYLGMFLSPQNRDKYDEQSLALLHGMRTGLDRLNSIVQQMLDMTRIEAGSMKLIRGPVVIKEVVESVVGVMEPFVRERGQTIVIDNFDHLPYIEADIERLHQLLSNLVANAIKFTPDGGQITLSAQVVPGTSSAVPDLHFQAEGDFVQITVADTGIGIDPDEQERIFARFYEVKDPNLHSTSQTQFMGGGVGLGLAIARGIAEAHGGWLWVESPGCDPETCPGSRFHVLLPVKMRSA